MSDNAKETVGGGGFKCPRCGKDIGVPDNMDDHNGSAHMFSNGEKRSRHANGRGDNTSAEAVLEHD